MSMSQKGGCEVYALNRKRRKGQYSVLSLWKYKITLAPLTG